MPLMEKGLDRTLRLHTIIFWIPAFALLLAHGITTRLLCPVLGIIPMTISAATGLVHYSGKAKSRIGNFVMDAFCAAFLFGILVPSWVMMTNGSVYWYWRSGGVAQAHKLVLGTYGTVPMLVNLAIHLYFILRPVFAYFRDVPKTCPHCDGVLDKSVRRHKGAYASVPAYEDCDDDVQDQMQAETAQVEGKQSGKEKVAPVRSVKSEPEATTWKAPRPSTDDETARLV